MRNNFPARCALCKKPVHVGGGRLERRPGRWKVWHIKCHDEEFADSAKPTTAKGRKTANATHR